MHSPRSVNRPLSITENSSLFANSIAPHNCVAYVDFTGNIEKKIFVIALNYLSCFFPCLRSYIKHEKKEGFKIISNNNCMIPFLQHRVARFEFDAIFEQEINTPFNLFESPLIRIIHLINGNENRLIITLHHLICDGISLSYFVGFLFEIIEAIMMDMQIISTKNYCFQSIEELIDSNNIKLNSILPANNPSFNNELNQGQKKNFITKAITFTVKQPEKKFYENIGINYLILAASSYALRPLINEKEMIKYVIPVNMRPYTKRKISNYELGFYSSWIEFEHSIGCEDNNIIRSLKEKTSAALSKKEHFSNLMSLQKAAVAGRLDGIIKNILNSNSPSVCVSNIGKPNIRKKYVNDYIQLQSIYFGLNSYYRANNCFLLIAIGLEKNIHFSFLYAEPYMSAIKALDCVERIKEFF